MNSCRGSTSYWVQDDEQLSLAGIITTVCSTSMITNITCNCPSNVSRVAVFQKQPVCDSAIYAAVTAAQSVGRKLLLQQL